MDFPKRKQIRLKDYDYNQNGAYFITICTKDRKKILSNIIVGTLVLDCPKILSDKRSGYILVHVSEHRTSSLFTIT